MKKIIIFQIILVTITLVIFAVFYLWFKPDSGTIRIESSDPLTLPSLFSDNKPPFINPTVISDIGKHYIINFKPLRDTIASIQSRYPQKTYVYFLYLNNGAWIGRDEREEFTAASTLKVPLAMSLMNAVSDDKLKLSDTYTLEELNLDNNFGDLYKMGAGKEFSVGSLMDVMLKQSDNTAMNAIVTVFRRIGIDDPLNDVYGALGWEFAQSIPGIGEIPDYSKINLKTLANMFLALYNAKYLDVEGSNKILAYLADTPFGDRIVAGVPESVTVSHKIGTAIQDETFSDCGIVYAPNRHYLLCLGSNGGDEKRAAQFMAEISKATYDYVINN